MKQNRQINMQLYDRGQKRHRRVFPQEKDKE